MTHGRGQCIYHLCPEQMVGTTLYPLNELATIGPQVYQREIAKYDDDPSRRALPETWLPGLECRWNDVIHTASIHPHRLYREWLRHRADIDPGLAFYVIPIRMVARLPLALMRPAREGENRDITPITADGYRELTDVPAETRAWYSKLVSQGRFGAHFVGVPHLLVKGPIETSRLSVIRWDEPLSD